MERNSKVTNTEFIDRARRGYNFLRDEGPRLGFNVNLLSPDTLDLSDACGCALGETFEMGHYWDAADYLAANGYPVATLDEATYSQVGDEPWPTFMWERQHGFMLAGADPVTPQAYAELTDAWREVIKRERDGKE